MDHVQEAQRITTFLTFASGGKEAVDFYLSVFKNSSLESVTVMPGSDQLLHAAFTLDGQHFMAMDAGPTFSFSDGISLFVTCQDQAEVDYYWEKLGAGGQYQPCGWLQDKYGVSWQIIPVALGELMSGSDHQASQRVMQAMLKMSKINVDELRAAADSNNN